MATELNCSHQTQTPEFTMFISQIKSPDISHIAGSSAYLRAIYMASTEITPDLRVIHTNDLRKISQSFYEIIPALDRINLESYYLNTVAKDIKDVNYWLTLLYEIEQETIPLPQEVRNFILDNTNEPVEYWDNDLDDMVEMLLDREDQDEFDDQDDLDDI